MSNLKKLNHVIYRCTYNVVWTPKYRFRVLEGLVKELLRNDIVMLLEWKSCEMIEMNLQKDYVRLIVSVPPKISISQLMETLKAKQQSRFSKVILNCEQSNIGAITFGPKAIVLTR